MQLEENKAIVCRLLDEAYGMRNLAVGDECLSTNVVGRSPGAYIEGIEAWKKFATAFLNAFPNLHISINDVIAEGDKVAAHWTCSGTHGGEFQGIAPTGKEVKWTGMGIYRFSGKKIEEILSLQDALGLMQQLDVIPTKE